MEGSTYQKSLLFTPEGVRDIYGEDCEKRYKVQNDIHAVMKLYGFKDIQTPTYEFFDIFNRVVIRGNLQRQHRSARS